MNTKIIITSGKKYIDIDAYSSIIAYKILLNSLGYANVYAISSAKENDSICPLIKELGFKFDNVTINKEDNFIILDVSNPNFFDNIVHHNNIIEIIDHHSGYEEFWKTKKNIKVSIQKIGSICTLIYEKIVENKKENILSKNLCKLLIAGIIDNTINLQTNNTTNRDIEAYNNLIKIGNIDKNWYVNYFNSCYKEIDTKLEEMIINDTKEEFICNLLPETFGQIIVPNINIINSNIQKIYSTYLQKKNWILNVISLKDKKSFIYFYGIDTKKNLEKIFKKNAKNNYIELNAIILRKEIINIAKASDN